MFRYRQAVVVVLMLGIVAAGVCGTAAEPSSGATLKRRVERLLETGWPRTADARAEASRRYDRLAPLVASEPRIPYAYALVQIRQYRYAEAIGLLDQVIAATPGNLTARELRIWLAILMKDYGKALGQMPQLVERLGVEKATADAELPLLELTGRLGRMCGFLEGPVQGGVDQTARAACVERLVSRLSDARRKAFEAGRKTVLHQFAAMGEETEMTTANAKESGEKIRKRVLEDLDQQAGDLAAKTEAEKTRLEDLKRTLKYELEKIQSRQQAVQQNLQATQSQAIAVQQDLRGMDGQIAQLFDLANREQDPDRRQRLLNDAAFWQIQRNQRAAALVGLDRQAAALVSEQQSLIRQGRDIDRRWKQESGQLDKIEGSLSRLQSDKERLRAKPVDGSTPQVVDQKRRIVALTAYVPLPISLEDEKARLLASFDTEPAKAETAGKPAR
jgi:hypothetical protein